MKHTPGPLDIKPRRDEWLIEGQNEDEGKTGVPYSGHGILIANVYEDYYAKLFASAPAMLAALKRVNEDLKDTFGYDSETGLHSRSLARTQKLIEDAIKQATGDDNDR